MVETFRPIEVSEYYINRVASGMSKYFWDNIFKEIFDILENNTAVKTVYNYNPYHDEKGRFCSVAVAVNKLIKDIKPVEIKSSDIAIFGKRNHQGIRDYVIEAFKQVRTVTITSNGRQVLFTKKGAKRISQKQSPADKEHNAFYAKIDEIVKRAKYFNFIIADEKHKDKVKGQEIYYSKFNIDGKPYKVKIAVDVPLDKYLEQGASYNYAGHRVNNIEIAPARIKLSVDNQHRLAETDATIIITHIDNNFNPIVNNSKDDVIKAIRNGSIWYENGAFRTKNRFSNAVAKTLEEMGAKFKYNAYHIPQNLIPFEYAETLAFAATQAALKADLIANFLGGYLLSTTDLKEYIESSVDLMYRKLELDILKSAQEKQIPVIELGIVQPKINLPKAQIQSIDKYWQEQDKKAEELQKAIRQAAKRGEDTKVLKTQLADLNKNAFENAPHIEFTIDDVKLDSKSKKIAQDYTYNMQYWVKKWEAKNIIKMRQDVLQMMQEGARVPRIQEYFEKRWKIAKNKAHFLAVNESHLAGAVIKATDYHMLGCNSFEWGKSSSKEKRELHKHYYGKVFTFDNKPIIDEELGIRGLPREIWNCKCHMLVVVPTLSELIKKRTEIKNAKRNIFKRIQNSSQRNNNAWRYRRFGQG